jgi:diguanylate cyclase (GGDEF)-like protein/PAS domain S-box-containing protein
MRKDETLDQLLDAALPRLEALWQRASTMTENQQLLLWETLEEFTDALHEMQVVVEELHYRTEELEVLNLSLAAERRRYQELFEFAPSAYLVTDLNAVIQEANQAAASLLKLPQASYLVGKPLFVFVAKEARSDYHVHLSQLQTGKEIRDWEVRLQPRQGKSVLAICTVAVVRSLGEAVGLRWLLEDITERQQAAEDRLLQETLHDALTGLPKRALLLDRLEQAIAWNKRRQNARFAVLCLDLDHFKTINLSFGHEIGDQLLRAIAQRLKACLRPTDTVARLGSDEFTILLEEIKDISDAIYIAERIGQELARPFRLENQNVSTTASIGIALSTPKQVEPGTILRDADIAMYSAKEKGGACYAVFDSSKLAAVD